MRVTENWAINGRFLTQSTTGVQRYAANVVKAIDRALTHDTGLPIIAPAEASNPTLARIPVIQRGPLQGHAWEQITLPAKWRGPLLNLCNTAPALKADQIVCIHDANIFAAPQSYSRAFRTYYAHLQPILARRSRRIATVSHASARQLARYLPIRLDDITILPNGHEHVLDWNPALATLAPDVVDAIHARGRQYVLALGSRAQHKNLELLIRAAKALDGLGIDVVIAGGGAGIFNADLLEQRSNVHLPGRVSDDDLAHLLQNALCLAFPSFTEGFGLPIIEAMALGCPVVASNCASMPEVCGPAALMASPVEIDQWIAHIKALKQSPTLGGELREQGLEQVRNFSWSHTAAGYLELLEQPARQLSSKMPKRLATLRTAVVIATRGRPDVVTATVRHLLDTQTLKPHTVIVSCVDIADAGSLASDSRVKVVTGKPGLTAQRNKALASLPPATDIVVFFDDDFVPHPAWLCAAAAAFADEVRLVGFTGRVIADGIKGPGIQFHDAVRLIDGAPATDSTWHHPYSPYGCNMAFRVSAIGEARFDERLVLYGWLEDRDFAAALAKQGGLFVRSQEAIGVHMGAKVGRVSGERLGYSQIVNPLYMLRKGTMTRRQVADQVLRNTASNLGRLLWPEPFIDRRGRLKGNFIGIADVLRGHLEPERAALLTAKQDFSTAAKGKAI
ncbi:glycosyltransferase [Rhizobium sp. LC145]|uniref:glycosyltransferase n=1 Tax=Rhizobium sp. LC145 TaxID=1120688 RepID=UPI00062A2930|nr:glycosyltransferase [Rhizobium sp. LC145]KKX24480.1 glycosyl transferase [Rhizobium sp. LC145]TKT46560.1 glycosyltransferase [Rhizobiaceae bacterium LC148]